MPSYERAAEQLSVVIERDHAGCIDFAEQAKGRGKAPCSLIRTSAGSVSSAGSSCSNPSGSDLADHRREWTCVMDRRAVEIGSQAHGQGWLPRCSSAMRCSRVASSAS